MRSLAEFDALPEVDRDRWRAEWEIEKLTCGCGSLVEDCSRPQTLYPYRRICQVTRAREAAQAMYAALHEKAPFHDGTYTRWNEHRTSEFPYRYDEGVTVGVDTVERTPWDYFTTRTNASPLPPRGAGGRGSQEEADHQERDDHNGGAVTDSIFGEDDDTEDQSGYGHQDRGHPPEGEQGVI